MCSTRPFATLLAIVALPLHVAGAQTYLEIDPIAYTVLHGYSGHVGQIFGRVRGEVSGFGLRIPSTLVGNKGWTVRMSGAGVNIDYGGRSGEGFFVGAGAGAGRYRFTLDSAGRSITQTYWSTSARTGYRWFPRHARHFYVAPWASLNYTLNAKPVVVSGQRYDQSRWQVFPTVHLGWRF